MIGSTSHNPVNTGATSNHVTPDATSLPIPAIEHGSGSAGNDPQKTKKRQTVSPVGSPGKEGKGISIASPTDVKENKLRKVDVGPAPTKAQFNPAHRAEIAANIDLSGELRDECDSAFQGVFNGFKVHNERMGVIENEVQKLIQTTTVLRRAAEAMNGNVHDQQERMLNLTHEHRQHEEAVINTGRRADHMDEKMEARSGHIEKITEATFNDLKTSLEEKVVKTLEDHQANFMDVKLLGMVTEASFIDLQKKFEELENMVKNMENKPKDESFLPPPPPIFGRRDKLISKAFKIGKSHGSECGPECEHGPPPGLDREIAEKMVNDALTQVNERFENIEAKILTDNL